MKINNLIVPLALACVAAPTHAELARMDYAQMAAVTGQAYYITVGTVTLPFSIKTLAERHIAIGPLGISAFAMSVHASAPTLTSLPRDLFIPAFNGINNTAYDAIAAGLAVAPPPLSTVGTTVWGYVAPVTLEFK
ncbi:MAG: hypothetical protein V4457_02300 [Pseudomonadota bacterium]|jgi:hypothetical protein